MYYLYPFGHKQNNYLVINVINVIEIELTFPL